LIARDVCCPVWHLQTEAVTEGVACSNRSPSLFKFYKILEVVAGS
jgi:hypothetical protein